MLATDGHAYLEKGGVIYPIFTEIPKKKPTEYRIAQAPTIADLSLDHDIPIQKKLKATIHSMPTLKVLSAEILWHDKRITALIAVYDDEFHRVHGMFIFQ